MTVKYSKQLLQAFNENCRKEMSKSLTKAYSTSYQVAREEFGNFWSKAQGYLRWLYADELLVKTAKKLHIDYCFKNNVKGNSLHPMLRSSNWSLTVHHIQSKNQKLPRKSRTRLLYQSKNLDLFDNEPENCTNGGHVYLLHDGINDSLSLMKLTIPSPDGKTIIYNEDLPIIYVDEAEVENVPDELNNKFMLLTEEYIRKKG